MSSYPGEKDNRPKLWLRKFLSPLVDRSYVTMGVGRTDFWSTKGMERAFADRSLLEAYERGRFNPIDDTFGLIAAVVVLLTEDNHMILAQRKGNEVAYAGGAWTATFEEQWNPLVESVPFDAVFRGLREEFGIESAHGFDVSIDDVRLYAVAREWGSYWNTVLIYVARLRVPAEKVLQRWNAFPPPEDKNEHTAVAAVPLTTLGREFLMQLVRMGRNTKLSTDRLKSICGQQGVVGIPSDGAMFPTHGRAKIIIGLWANGDL
jgi:hypothetical protein